MPLSKGYIGGIYNSLGLIVSPPLKARSILGTIPMSKHCMGDNVVIKFHSKRLWKTNPLKFGLYRGELAMTCIGLWIFSNWILLTPTRSVDYTSG